MNFEEDSLKLFFTPGHTKDSISIFDKVEKALYVGDSFGFFNDKVYWWTKTKVEARELLEVYKQFEFDMIIPGHSKPVCITIPRDEAIKKMEDGVEKSYKE